MRVKVSVTRGDLNSFKLYAWLENGNEGWSLYEKSVSFEEGQSIDVLDEGFISDVVDETEDTIAQIEEGEGWPPS
jgi:hypothetical protein